MKTFLKWFTTNFLYKLAKLVLAELTNRNSIEHKILTNNIDINMQVQGLPGVKFKALASELIIKNMLPKQEEFTQEFKCDLTIPEYELTIWLDQQNAEDLVDKFLNVKIENSV